MARKKIPVVPVTRKGTVIGNEVTLVPTHDGYFVNDGRTFLMARNGTGSSVNVYFTMPNSGAGDVVEVSYVVPAGQIRNYGPFPVGIFNHGPEQYVANHTLSSWLSSTDIEYWGESVTAGTITREAPGFAGQPYCAKLERTTSGTLYLTGPTGPTTFRLQASKTYELEVAYRGTGQSQGVALAMVNQTRARYIWQDGSWQGSPNNYAKLTATPEWQTHKLVFSTEGSPSADTDIYRMELYNGGSIVGTTIYYGLCALTDLDSAGSVRVNCTGSILFRAYSLGERS